MASDATVASEAVGLADLGLTAGGELALVADPPIRSTALAVADAVTGDSVAEVASEATAFESLDIQVGLDLGVRVWGSPGAGGFGDSPFVASSSVASADGISGNAMATATTTARGWSSGAWQIGRDLHFDRPISLLAGEVGSRGWIGADSALSAVTVTGEADAVSDFELVGLEGLLPQAGSPLVGRNASLAMGLKGNHRILSQSVSGDATTEAALDVQGIEDSLLTIGGNLDLSVLLDIDHQGRALTQAGAATNTLDLDVQGVEDVDPVAANNAPPEWEVGDAAELSASVLVRSLTEASTGSGDATATSELDLQVLEDFSLTVGADLRLYQGFAALQSETSAFAVTGNATAEGIADLQVLEGDFDDPISWRSGADLRLSLDARAFAGLRNSNESQAFTTTGDAVATANSEGLAGVAKADLIAGQQLVVNAAAQLLTQAHASSVSAGEATAEAVLGERLPTAPATPTDAERLSSLDAVGAILGANNSVDSGTSLQLVGILGSFAPGSLPNRTFAQAENVTGDASATAAMPSAFAVKLAAISAGENATLGGFNSAVLQALAATTSGDSQADVFVTRTAGVEVLGAAGQIPVPSTPFAPSLRIGVDGTLVGQVSLAASAQAQSVTSSSPAAVVSASVGSEEANASLTVVGINLPMGSDRAQVGVDLRPASALPFPQYGLVADATLAQSAQASSVTGTVEAQIGEAQATQVIGLQGDLDVGDALSSARLAAASNQLAIATTVMGQADSFANGGSVAIRDSVMSVGASASLIVAASSQGLVQSGGITSA